MWICNRDLHFATHQSSIIRCNDKKTMGEEDLDGGEGHEMPLNAIRAKSDVMMHVRENEERVSDWLQYRGIVTRGWKHGKQGGWSALHGQTGLKFLGG